MGLWKRLFGQSDIPAEERRDVDRVSCMVVVRIIRNRVATFTRSKGMVVVLLEGCRVKMYFFDGVSRASWVYSNHQFSTDRVGQTFFVGSMEVALTVNTEHLLPKVIEREFSHCDISIQPLWKLDPAAWDYEIMKALYGEDVGIRISFDELPAA